MCFRCKQDVESKEYAIYTTDGQHGTFYKFDSLCQKCVDKLRSKGFKVKLKEDINKRNKIFYENS